MGSAPQVKPREPDTDTLSETLSALHVLQNDFYSAERGTWPESIDWTGAVIGTHFSAAVNSISETLASISTGVEGVEDWKLKQNVMEGYFTQLVAYYFGEAAETIKGEAYDDILWVVLGWIEAVRLVKSHSSRYYQLETQDAGYRADSSGQAVLGNRTWHGNTWTPAFASRARAFWNLGSEGWDTKLCDGGMIVSGSLVLLYC
jgi:hypothetical protein